MEFNKENKSIKPQYKSIDKWLEAWLVMLPKPSYVLLKVGDNGISLLSISTTMQGMKLTEDSREYIG